MKKTDNPRIPTEAQIDANRENAKKSTGPRSAEGKAASSRNGLKHGLCAGQHLLPGEDPEEFLFLLKDLSDRLRPEGPAEEKLVQRIAAGQWRLDRALPIEAGIYRDRCREVSIIDRQQQEVHEWEIGTGYKKERPPVPHNEGDLLARAFIADAAGPNSLTKLARYETAIGRSIDRSLRQLKAFQAARNTPAPTPQPDCGPPAKSPEPAETKPQTPPDPASVPSQNTDCKANPKNGGTTPHPAPTICPPQPITRPAQRYNEV
jgi:hypothetical protein